MSILLWFLLLALLLLSECSFSLGFQAIVRDNNSYQVVDDNNETLFDGHDIAVYLAGGWCATNSTTPSTSRLILTGSSTITNKSRHALGNLTDGSCLTWTCHDIPVNTCFENYNESSAVIFSMQWPNGAPNTALEGDFQSAITNFPALTVSNKIPLALSWEGSFVQSVRGYSKGPQGGPTVFYNDDLSTVVIGSWWGGNWKSFTAGNNTDYLGTTEDVWSPGTSGRITELHVNYTQEILLIKSKSKTPGIRGAIEDWGARIQASRPSKGTKKSDITLQKIGYQTDNGAYYCFCQDHNCSNTLINELEYLRHDLAIPMGYLSFQGAGASSGRGHAAPWCVDTWGVDGGLGNMYPLDLKSFQKALDIPLQLYAPYFCPLSTYFGDESQWNSVISDESLPGCSDFAFQDVHPSQSKEFYDWFFDKGMDVGMVSFEPDFMNQNHNCVPDFIRSTSKVEMWQQGMADAAMERNITVQWCYATPSDVLASVDMPAVTNFRVSFDFCYGESWNIGESSLLVGALGAAPSKDTLWTTDNNHTAIWGCDWTPDHENIAAELHVILALMSTGPMGISDAIGMTNKTLIERSIAANGDLLKPTRAITSIDSSFVEDIPGYIYSTSGMEPSWIFCSFKMKEVFPVRVRDFWPHIRPLADFEIVVAQRLFTSPVCHNGANAELSGCVQLIPLKLPLLPTMPVFSVPVSSQANVTGGTDFSPTLSYVWQNCVQSQWFLLGELDKYVPLSPSRFHKLACIPTGVLAIVKGSEKEIVRITALKPRGDEFEVVTKTTIISATGFSMVLFGSSLSTKS